MFHSLRRFFGYSAGRLAKNSARDVIKRSIRRSFEMLEERQVMAYQAIGSYTIPVQNGNWNTAVYNNNIASNDPKMNTPIILESGLDYRLQVTGTMRMSTGPDRPGDAEYYIPKNANGTVNYDAPVWEDMSLVPGATHNFGVDLKYGPGANDIINHWGPYNQLHYYNAEVTGKGQSFATQFIDSNYSDNANNKTNPLEKLRVTVFGKITGDLDILNQNLDDALEATVGGFLAVGEVGQLKIESLQKHGASGDFTIEYDQDQVRLYKEATLETLITSGSTILVGDILYVIGDNAVAAEVSLNYSTSGSSEEEVDRVKLQLIDIDIDIDSNNDGNIDVFDDAIEEYAPGAYLFVNDDDDNGNSVPDNSNNEIGPVSNESDLSVFHLNNPFTQLDVYSSEVSYRLDLIVSGPVAVWQDAQRTIAQTVFSWEPNDTIPTSLYLEGLSAGAFTLNWQLVASPTSGTARTVAGDTVVGIVDARTEVLSVVWQTYRDNINLSNNPVFNPSGASTANYGLRIFSDDKVVNDANSATRKVVSVIADIGVQKANVLVWFKVWDIDDPASNMAIDSNDGGNPINNNGEDNAEKNNYGFISQDENHHAQLTNGDVSLVGTPRQIAAYTDNQGLARVLFSTSLYAGDNYMITAATGKFDSGLKDLDQTKIDNYITDANANPLADNIKSTDFLTVWRQLHVERDSMTTIPLTGDEANYVSATIVRIENVTINNTIYQHIVLDTDLSVDLPSGIDDSPNLDSNQAKNGRFENGKLFVGNNTIPETTGILGNGKLYIRSDGGSFKIKATIKDSNGGAEKTLEVDEYKSENEIDVFRFVEDIGAGYVDGTITIGGIINTIKVVDANDAKKLAISMNPFEYNTIPCRITDDDGPFTPKLSELDQAKTAFSAAYIEVRADGGGDLSNERLDVPFKLNVSDNTIYSTFDSRDKRREGFWVAYVLNAFQGPPSKGIAEQSSDFDSNSEDALLGVTLTNQTHSGSYIYSETIRDKYVSKYTAILDMSRLYNMVVAHEIGHQLGLGHTNGGLMHDGLSIAANDIRDLFLPSEISFLRSKIQMR